MWILPLLAAVGCVDDGPAEAPPARPAPVTSESPSWLPIETVVEAAAPGARGERARSALRKGWRNGYAVMLVEVLRFTRPPLRPSLVRLLEASTGQTLGGDLEAWFRWIWKNRPETHPDYPAFKARVYSGIDPSFRRYFEGRSGGTIRLDEVRWGGVRRDGIPPLRAPKVEPAAKATWLADDHVVFGVAIDGMARAYPKRILGWHEMVVDTLGKVPITGVYCTLCNAMIVYRSVADGTHHRLGTSGFLYRSNKLMYDLETRSLWSTLEGRPVFGPLVGKGIRLEPLHGVTTTWGEWRRRHPETTVLSLETGHRRDYGEGAAYRAYFATDRLMFGVPARDRRLPNKAEVLALRFGAADARPTAIRSGWLADRPVHAGEQGGVPYVILTDRSGAHRVYRRGAATITGWDRIGGAVDATGGRWRVTEAALLGPKGERWARLPAHRAFWFAWYAAHPTTRLVGAPSR